MEELRELPLSEHKMDVLARAEALLDKGEVEDAVFLYAGEIGNNQEMQATFPNARFDVMYRYHRGFSDAEEARSFLLDREWNWDEKIRRQALEADNA